MAGFSVFVGFLSLCIVGGASAFALALALRVLAKRRIERLGYRKHPFVTRCEIAPFLGLAWVLASFIVHVVVSNQIAHQDCGFELSVEPYVTLPNGYVVGDYGEGYVRAPGASSDLPLLEKTRGNGKPDTYAPPYGPGYIRSVYELQWTGRYFLGTQFDYGDSKTHPFLFDTSDWNYHEFSGEDNAAWAATKTQFHYVGNNYMNLYWKYWKRWPKYVFIAMIVFGELLIVRWVYAALPSAVAAQPPT